MVCGLRFFRIWTNLRGVGRGTPDVYNLESGLRTVVYQMRTKIREASFLFCCVCIVRRFVDF